MSVAELIDPDEETPFSTERVPGAARNYPKGVPPGRPTFARVLPPINTPSPTDRVDPKWIEAPEKSELTTPKNDVLPPIVTLPSPTFSLTRSQLLQQWEGTVLEVDNGNMVAHLRDLGDPDRVEERATVELEHVTDDDLPLVTEGAVFYWSIGYHIEPHGQKNLKSSIRFRRLPAWTASEVAKAKRLASKYDAFFNNHE